MRTGSGYDVRAVANLVLLSARENQKEVSNLSLNKIIYFLHVAFLHNFEIPLVSAKIEAWDHGPVFREIYHQFKVFGSGCIHDLAKKVDPVSGKYLVVRTDFSGDETIFLTKLCEALLNIPAGRLVDMSHVVDGAWFRARNREGMINPGAEITNEMIIAVRGRESSH